MAHAHLDFTILVIFHEQSPRLFVGLQLGFHRCSAGGNANSISILVHRFPIDEFLCINLRPTSSECFFCLANPDHVLMITLEVSFKPRHSRGRLNCWFCVCKVDWLGKEFADTIM